MPGGPLTHIGATTQVLPAVMSGLRGLSALNNERGAIGPLELPAERLARMARAIAKTPQDIPDVQQHGTKIALERMAKRSMSGPEMLAAARGGMKDYRPSNTRGLGARVDDIKLLEKVQAHV
ncbi:MAG: hypothetical protein ACRDHG_14085, partial [Anaerolineales bacterium]